MAVEEFKIDKNIVKTFKYNELLGLVLCYLTNNSNLDGKCKFTLRNIIEENGYLCKSGTNKNFINNKIKDTLRYLISKNYMYLINNPYTNKSIKDFNHVTVNDEIWVQLNPVDGSFILVNRDNYFKILQYCQENKHFKNTKALIIYMYIIGHINKQEKNGKCSVGYESFVEDLKMSKSSICKYIEMLADLEIIYKKKGNRIFTNEYYLKPIE